MATKKNHPSRAKYLNLLKQTTGIELDIASPDEFEEEVKPIHQAASGEHIFIKSQGLNLLQRAQRREQLLRSRQQNNLEQIFSLALEYVNQDAQFDKLDLDWMMKFTELAIQSYSSTMHELWAKILAVELSHIGTFSYKSLKTLSELSSREANTFYKAVKLMSRLGEEKGGKIFTGVYKKPTLMSIFTNNNRLAINLSKFGLSYPQIMTLVDLGLIYNQEIESAPYQTNDQLKLSYQGQSLQLKILTKDVVFTYYKFTETGYELSKLVTLEQDKTYLNSLVTEFSSLVAAKVGNEQKV